ncbi:hypothetical protein [Neorhizobium sp. NCHU2750]|uniref:hypothetical protein n=1 Tax=Neorhizobium sp. NCHU2750 TaxID=1825976 RepID=UPI000E738AA2|nr:hypothetical protein NCHU2750_12550 [Neorhizobium sp. NCHU2750]
MQEQLKRVLIVGMGVLAGDVLDFLSQSQQRLDIIIGARNPDAALLRVNLARYSALNLGFTPQISVIRLDLMEIEETADAIDRLKPDIIFNAATLQSWWAITKLPRPAFDRLDRARGGIWTPMHMVLVRRLMKAVRACGSRAMVINASYPDVVNAALASEGLAPAVGIGNVANAVPGLRLAAAYLFDSLPASISVRFFAHHYLSYRMPSSGVTDGAPYHLTIYIDGQRVDTDARDEQALFELVAGQFRRTKGLAGQSVTASSATAVILAGARASGDVVHAPGPMGLVGGYPVRFSKDGLLVELPPGLTLDRAVAINREAQRYDGIEDVDDDGTVSFTPEVVEIAKTELGYECAAFLPAECEAMAYELGARYAEYSQRFAA